MGNYLSIIEARAWHPRAEIQFTEPHLAVVLSEEGADI